MKKILIILTLLISTFSFSQSSGVQEVKVDLLDALALKTVEISYEYYITSQSAIGISALFNFEKRSADFKYNEEEMFTPFFRHYFTATQSWNYFGEVFFGLNSGDKDGKDYTDGALGLALGSKYISSGGFVFELHAGLGRNLFTSKSPIIVPRLGVNLGYQF